MMCGPLLVPCVLAVWKRSQSCIRRQTRWAGACYGSFLEPVAFLTGAEHVSVHRGPGQADSERLTVRGKDGEPDEGAGVQVQTGGGEPQAAPGQAVQGKCVPPPPRPGLVSLQASPLPSGNRNREPGRSPARIALCKGAAVLRKRQAACPRPGLANDTLKGAG